MNYRQHKTGHIGCILLSLGIELIHFKNSLISTAFLYSGGGHYTDVDDVILNTFSGLLGCCVYTMFQKAEAKVRRGRVV